MSGSTTGPDGYRVAGGVTTVFVVTVIVSVLLAVVFARAGAPKVALRRSAVDRANHLGVPVDGYRWIGVAEWAAAIGLVVGIRWTIAGILATVGLVLLMFGATVLHRRAGDPANATFASTGLGLLAVVDLVLFIAR